jgi:hypothetical protein
MTRFRVIFVLVALSAVGSTSHAQQWGRSSSTASGRHGSTQESQQASGGAWNGTASQWGGSPVQAPAASRLRFQYVIPSNVYIPVAVAAAAPVAVTYVVDTVYALAPAGAVEMRVLTSRHEPREQTTMDVYREQRFGKP